MKNTTQKTYIIEEESKTLQGQKTFDENQRLIYSINYTESPSIENRYEYDETGNLIKQIETQGNIENSAQTFEYGEDGTIIDQKLFIAGHLYEHIKLEKTENGFTRTMFVNGEEIERLEKSFNGKNWHNSFYLNGELLEEQKYVFNTETNTAETEVSNYEDDHFIVIKEKYNEQSEVTFEEKFLKGGSLLSSTEIEINNGLILKETIKEFLGNDHSYERSFEYDEFNNMTKYECRSSTGALLSFHNRWFNDKNQLVEETGYANGYFSGITGIQRNNEQFHLIHDYEIE